MNTLDDRMLSKIMKRVCQAIHMSHDYQQTFTNEEMLKLQESLLLNSEQLSSMLRYASYIIQQVSSSFFIIYPFKLMPQQLMHNSVASPIIIKIH